MNISHCVSSIDISSGGTSVAVSDICKSLSEYCSIKLITSITCNPYLTEVGNGFSIQFLNGRFDGLVFRSFLLNDNSDLMHGHGMWDLSTHWLAYASRKRNIPYVLSPHGMLEPWALQQGKWKKKIALKAYQYADLKYAHCIHVTAEMEFDSVRSLGFNNPVALIPNGIDVSQFPQRQLVSSDIKQRKILFLSRVHPKKGIELLIDAWAMIPVDIRQNWGIDIVGNGEQEYLNSLQIRIDNQGLQNQISIVGPKFGEDKIISYQSADVFVLPTYSENFGVVVAEALASGVPVITTKGAPWKCLVDHQCGWWIDTDAHALKDALLEAMALSDQERFEMGSRGRKLVLDEFSIDAVAEKMHLLYQWILGEAEKPDFVYIN